MQKDVSAELQKFNVSQLGSLFGLHRDTVRKRLKHVAPTGKDGRGYPAYTVKAAAPFLVEMDDIKKPDYSGEDDNGNEVVNPEKLALIDPAAFKDYWTGKNAEAKYNKEMGDTWDTMEVIQAVSGLLSPIALFLQILPDNLERVASLKPEQVELVTKECRKTQQQLYDEICEKYGIVAEL